MADEKKTPGLRPHEDTALSLFQLIGAPLHALVQAEKQAADATASFIRDVGFLPDPKPATQAGGGESPLDRGAGDGLGAMRMARFRRVAPDGTVHSVEVPLLSLVPIPALQIKEAQLEFAVKVVDTIPLRPDRTAQPGTGLASPIDLKGAIGRPTGQGSRHSETQMKLKVTIQQADVPAGLSRLFNLMDQQISVGQQPPLSVRPSTLTLAAGAAASVDVTVLGKNGRGKGGVPVAAEAPAALALEPRGEAVTDGDGKGTFRISVSETAPAGQLSVVLRAKPEDAEWTTRLIVQVTRPGP